MKHAIPLYLGALGGAGAAYFVNRNVYTFIKVKAANGATNTPQAAMIAAAVGAVAGLGLAYLVTR